MKRSFKAALFDLDGTLIDTEDQYTVVWGCVWAVLIFHERLTLGKIAGAALVLAGVALYGYADGKAGCDE